LAIKHIIELTICASLSRC